MQVIPIMEGKGMPKSDNREALNGLFSRLCTDYGESSGMAIIKTIVEELGGLRVSIPNFDDLNREDRDRRIRNLFTGNNYNELAERFGLSVRQVRYIIDEHRGVKRGENA